MELNVLHHHRLKIASIQKQSISYFMHSLVKLGFLEESRCRFFSLTETCRDYSLVMDEKAFSELQLSHNGLSIGPGIWIPLTASAAAYTSTLAGLSNIAKCLITPLADHNISIYSLSSYQTDYILVREESLDQAIQCLCPKNNTIKHSSPGQGQTYSLDVGVLKPQGHSLSSLDECRPLTHDFSTPKNKFHIASIDPDTLPSVGLHIIQVLFYPRCTSSHCDNEHFCCYMFVDNEGTLVVDSEDFKLFPDNVIFVDAECWKMIKICDLEDGLGFSECGIVAQILDPIANANITLYYISTFYSDHTLVPESTLDMVTELLRERRNPSIAQAPV